MLQSEATAQSPALAMNRKWTDLPSGYVKIAIENCQFIVDFPIKHGDFP